MRPSPRRTPSSQFATVAVDGQPPRSAGTPGQPRLRRHLLAAVWTVSTLAIGAVVLTSGATGPESVAKTLLAVLLLGATTAALLSWLGRPPAEGLPGAAPVTGRGRLAGLVTVVGLVLFPAGVAGVVVLVPLAAVAAGVLVRLRREVDRRQVGWALVLGLVAAGGGVLDGVARGNGPGVLFGAFQLPLTLVTLLAGWALARRAGWVPAAIGPSVALTAGPARGVRVAGWGFLLAVPWALGNVVNGPLETDHVTKGWQPVAAALQPGVAEEAWGRVFLIAALYVLFRRVARPDTALLCAALLATLWFAFLHAPAAPLTTLFLAALHVLPMTWLFLRRGLEAAIGFHVCLDLVRYAAAYAAFIALWSS
ncbi:CAAX protease self-immunity [Geodermatophilus obscurus]|uniref:CAAX protease self-immunity n=1 Tax=Geodermatophilus obscurus TaxID=1861 RepID=A0A1M7UZJ4_9ACTN|nr:CPBP family glutamic-type intramembrane protease [Geodermatophilus obscurus]SHN88389.1 CAAX protease self-immunity [Geodermatophilus obscurus]